MERYDSISLIKHLLSVEGFAISRISDDAFNQSNRLTLYFSRNVDMSVSNFAAVCDAMGYDVCVVSRDDNTSYALNTERRLNNKS